MTTPEQRWSLRNRDRVAEPRDTTLWLEYEVAGTYNMGADWSDETADELLREYLRTYSPSDREIQLPAGYVHITWSVQGDQAGPELAPFQRSHYPDRPDRENFLTFFEWPRNVHTDERLDFNTLPVRRLQWNETHHDPGGFVSEATGWHPAPMQPCLHLAGLIAAYDHEDRFTPLGE